MKAAAIMNDDPLSVPPYVLGGWKAVFSAATAAGVGRLFYRIARKQKVLIGDAARDCSYSFSIGAAVFLVGSHFAPGSAGTGPLVGVAGLFGVLGPGTIAILTSLLKRITKSKGDDDAAGE